MNIKVLDIDDWNKDERSIFNIKEFTAEDVGLRLFRNRLIISVDDRDLLFDTVIFNIGKNITYKSNYEYDSDILLSLLEILDSKEIPLIEITENKLELYGKDDYSFAKYTLFVRLNSYSGKSATFSSTVNELAEYMNTDPKYVKMTLDHREPIMPYSSEDIRAFKNYIRGDIRRYQSFNRPVPTDIDYNNNTGYVNIALVNGLYMITRFCMIGSRVEITLFEDEKIKYMYRLLKPKIFDFFNENRLLLMKTAYDYFYGRIISANIEYLTI